LLTASTDYDTFIKRALFVWPNVTIQPGSRG
jgi:hypothetical protein